MYLSELKITNFRQFKEITIPLSQGITAFVGKNDSGKTAVMDALRLALTTRDREPHWIQLDDFYIDGDGNIETTFSITCTFSELTQEDISSFLEFVTYNSDGSTSLFLTYSVSRRSLVPERRWLNVNVHNGKNTEGNKIDSDTRELLAATYLKPLRDAKREMSAGKNSRLSQILSQVDVISEGSTFTSDLLENITAEEIEKLGIVGLADFFAHYIKEHQGIAKAKEKINEEYLTELSFSHDTLHSDIQFVSHSNENIRLRQVLERLELLGIDCLGNLGLGSNNLLFMACELLLLNSEKEGFPILLIEEPEAHLHPQRQLRLMDFLKKTLENNSEETQIQIVLTTHSPNLASVIPLENLIILTDKQAFPLSSEYTKLDKSDYKFIGRFLDTTKANLFFAHGIIIVEGDAEALLLPILAKLMGIDLAEYGVSIVNVGGTGLSRYSKIFQRREDTAPLLPIPVACITDRDIMPDCAPEILGLDSSNTKRRWKMESDFNDNSLEEYLKEKSKNDGQNVQTFIADYWTFEYDLAYDETIDKLVHQAITLAKNDDKILDGKKTKQYIIDKANSSFPIEDDEEGTVDDVVEIYKPLIKKQASKAITAQYLADLLTNWAHENNIKPQDFKDYLPSYIVKAIEFAITDLTNSSISEGLESE